jgi:hypothetical protein
MFPGDLSHTKMTEGVDALMDFQPLGVEVSGLPKQVIASLNKKEPKECRPSIYDYSDYVDYCINTDLPLRCFPCVSPGFDNSPRRVGKTFLSFTEMTPQNYGRWLYDALRRNGEFAEDDENIVFINAWNEWAEGNHIEPDQKWGRAYLEETLRVRKEYDASDDIVQYQEKRKEERKAYRKKLEWLKSRNVYSQCKAVMKDRDVSYKDAYSYIIASKDKLSRKQYYKLIYKLLFYKACK